MEYNASTTSITVSIVGLYVTNEKRKEQKLDCLMMRFVVVIDYMKCRQTDGRTDRNYSCRAMHLRCAAKNTVAFKSDGISGIQN